MKTKEEFLQDIVNVSKDNKVLVLNIKKGLIIGEISTLKNLLVSNDTIELLAPYQNKISCDKITGEEVCSVLIKHKERELKEVEKYIEYLS